MSNSILILSFDNVIKVSTSFSSHEIQSMMASVFFTLSHNHLLADADPPTRIAVPHRTAIDMRSHRALFMPARIENMGTTIKVVSNPLLSTDTRGIPASTLVLDESTGVTRALVNARSLTALRTAAGSVLATTLLHPPTMAKFRHVVAFGAGSQIKFHVTQLLATYPYITHITIVNRTINDRLAVLLANLRADHPTVDFVGISSVDDSEQVELAVRRADCVCCATSSTAPLFPSEWVRTGTHVILVGSYKPEMVEVDSALIHRARIMVDSRDACAVEAGELINAGVSLEELVEVGELIRRKSVHDEKWAWEPDARKIAELLSESDVTIFKSVGLGVQDVAIAVATVDRAMEMGIGTVIPNFDI